MTTNKTETVTAKHDHHIVSVVIPTIGRSTINLCKNALERQTRPPQEVIVFTDHERRGASWARNEGLSRARGDLIAFIDDDCQPHEDWLERLVKAIDKYDAAGAGGTYEETDPLLQNLRLLKIVPDTEQVDTIGLVGTGGNVMYKRAWLDTLAKLDGYVFNEAFKSFGSEDWELALRLRLLEAKLIYVPSKVVHLRRVALFPYFRHQFNRGIGIALLFNFHRSLKKKLAAHKSLIWDDISAGKRVRWFSAFLYKAIGPFDVMNFERMRNFWLFWIGEKFQGAGFIWGMIHHGITIEKAQDKNQQGNR